MPVQKSDESFPKITETANTTTEDSLAMKPSAEPSPAGTKSKLGSTSNSLLKTTTSGFSTKNEFEIKARSAQSELRRAAGDTAKRIERTINYGLIREIDAIVNRPEELGYDCFAELPSLQKMRKQYPDMPDPSRRPVLVGKEMNPIRKLMMEQRQQEIMRKMAVGGLETEAEEKKERQRAVVYSIEQSEKNLYFLERENEEYENSLLLKKAQLEQEQLEKVKQGERRALTMSQNFVVPDKAMAATGGPGTLGRSRGLGGSMGSARFGGPSQPEQQKKMQALKELLAQPAAAPAEVIVGAETNVRQKVELKPQVALGVDSYEDENMLAEVYRSRVADEERARAKAAAELAKKKRHDRQHTTREMRLVEFMQTKREMAGVKAMYDEQTRAVRYGDAETQKMEAVLQLSKEEFENEQARILERSEKR
ncbi:unnamed protein product [Amoebophrya sp. A25]|nr:unnamed protein product [Amoebophrya sp. A25]|eukprot:GSA25T00007196001.1